MIYILLIVATLFRLVPHPANFTPLGALILFVSFKYGYKKGLLFGLSAMVISDLFLGFNFTSLFVYLGFVLYALSAKLIGKKLLGYILAPAVGSVIFFIVTNLGVFSGPWYPHTANGLTNCFIAAIPFFRNTIMADLIFTALIFGADYVYNKYAKNKLSEVTWQKKLQKGISSKKF